MKPDFTRPLLTDLSDRNEERTEMNSQRPWNVPTVYRAAWLVAAATLLVGVVAVNLNAQDFTGLPANGFDTSDPVVDVAPVANVAATPAPAQRSLLDILKSGGLLMIPIGICSFVLVVFVFERFISLRKARIIPGPFTKRFLEQLREGELNQSAAITLCDRNNSEMANVFKAGIQKWGRPAVEVEQAVLDEGERTSNRLRKYLRLINGVATVCPLIGMLGTVLGMIHAFDAIATVTGAVSDPMMMADGISKAMLTTAAGLSVAIPAYIAYLFFCGRVDKHVMEIDSLGMKVVNLVSAEALMPEPKSRGTRRAA